MSPLELQIQINDLKKFYSHNQAITSILNRSIYLLNDGKLDEAQNLVKSVPSNQELLINLINKLKTKSVFKTLKEIHDTQTSNLRKLIGYSSLITHVAIECEHGNFEYAMLLPQLLERQNEICYQMMENPS